MAQRFAHFNACHSRFLQCCFFATLKIMKRFVLWFLLCLVGLPLFAFGTFKVYLLVPRFFPTYPLGSCVEDTQVYRIHEITGYDDWFKGSGVPTRIIQRGTAAPGMYLEGSLSGIDVNDPAIRPIPCPSSYV